MGDNNFLVECRFIPFPPLKLYCYLPPHRFRVIQAVKDFLVLQHPILRVFFNGLFYKETVREKIVVLLPKRLFDLCIDCGNVSISFFLSLWYGSLSFSSPCRKVVFW